MAKPKVYPLEVRELWEFEGGFCGFYSKGHHDPQIFLDAIRARQHQPNALDDLDITRVRHRWVRCLPVAGGGSYMIDTTPGRVGSFPLTEIE